MEVYFLLIVLTAFSLIAIAAHSALGNPNIIKVFESRFGAPGTSHVVPECGCTFRYVGTKIEGTDYFVHFKKMD